MKPQGIFIIISILALNFLACSEVTTEKKSQESLDPIPVEQRTTAVIPPKDIWIFNVQLDRNVKWQAVDKWYRKELPSYKNKAYYRNLKEVALFTLIQIKRDFVNTAPLEKLIFYAEEDRKMHRISGLKSMAILYRYIAERGKEKVAAHFAHDKLMLLKNDFNFPGTTKEEYLRKYQSAIIGIKALQYDNSGNLLIK